ncbi:beta-1,2-xylosyltransferase XYXT1 isoform X2 [Elaeis guineensis]|uniref:Alpha-1,3-arabinosyltransferase XAT3 isoform X2 n=1 Tax=Elaeis guineensis var. tenera TaxID=51953 RepID=A0A6I9QXV7_ELAGV|nr:alpha-1,3-arabinosyltransferase XAT3 isoform X2 [Elaeis guineensis]
MGYEAKLVRSFSRIEPQKLGLGLLATCFLVSLVYISVTDTFAVRFPILNSWLSSSKRAAATSPLVETTLSSPQLEVGLENTTHESRPSCDDADPRSSVCGENDAIETHQNSSSTASYVPFRKEEFSNSTQELEVGLENTTHESRPICDDVDPRSSVCAKNDATETYQNSSSTASYVPFRKEEFSNGTPEVGSEKVEQGISQPCDTKSGHCETDSDGRTQKNMSTIVDPLPIPLTSSSSEKDERIEDLEAERKPLCDTSARRVDVCEMDGDVRILGKNSSVIYMTPSKIGALRRSESWKVRPYARKTDKAAMAHVREVSLKSLENYEEAPRCTVHHTVPAIVFSIAGYTGNYFHDFTDVLVPLFLTSYQFNGEVQFLVTNFKLWWIHKYLPIFKKLSNYEIIDFDNDEGVHCFKHAIVGLKAHSDMIIDPSKAPNGYSMVDFTRFLRSAYSLERSSPIRIGEHPGKKPRLLIIARSRTRRFVNVDKIIRMAEKLGFEVVVSEADNNVTRFAHIVNSCDVMMGVHGAGLTNLVFLPTNAILIQVVPWGGLDWIATTYFNKPSKGMNLRYLEYSITEEESTLIDQYPRDHAVFKDPSSIHKLGWAGMMEVFLVKQNVRLNVRRFRPVLIKALKLLHQ